MNREEQYRKLYFVDCANEAFSGSAPPDTILDQCEKYKNAAEEIPFNQVAMYVLFCL